MRRRGFSLFEILAVLALIAIVLGVSFANFRSTNSRLRSAAQQLTKDIQAVYFQSVKKSKVYRISFEANSPRYVITRYLPPQEPPDQEEDPEAYREWEEIQEEKERALAELSVEERRALTRLDRGDFELIREKRLPEFLRIESIQKLGEEESSLDLVFYPTGEMDAAKITIGSDSDDKFTLMTLPLTGKVRSISREITEEEWLEELESE